ncbi:DinB family protein [Bacillus sp. 1P06AnD]|uniref:DinB family protein n=1 Tax=Bacillus sp. 1P06AnD TaxID=3132208 RepID=UPI0039A27465
MDLKIQKKDGFTPQIGQLVSMMEYARNTTLWAVEGLTIEQLDYLPYEGSNSIGALLLHMAAVERYYQIDTFEKREPTLKELEELKLGLELGDEARIHVKGNPLSFYLDKLATVRSATLEEFRKRDDEWLNSEVMWGKDSANHYFLWFHVFEDELNHRGQIRILKKMQK